jgi:hypothetical protein
MAIEKHSYLYEILIRFDEDGFAGAHVKDLETVFDADDGVVYSAKETEPRNVTEAEVGEILGAQAAVLIETVDRERVRAAAAEAGLGQANEALAAVQAQCEDLEAELVKVKASHAVIDEQLSILSAAPELIAEGGG